MTIQEQTLADLVTFLDATKTPYMIIGGLANIVWGVPRATLDIDVTVWVEDPDVSRFVADITKSFRSIVDRPAEFVAKTRVLPVESRAGVRIDVIFGQLPFERDAINRAKSLELAGSLTRVCTAEDLILMKIISDRERDIGDARAIVERRLPELDLRYLVPRIEELSRLLDRPDVAARWDEWTRR